MEPETEYNNSDNPQDGPPAGMAASTFLGTLWGKTPPGVVNAFVLPDRDSYWFRDISRIDEFLKDFHDKEVYTGVSLADQQKGRFTKHNRIEEAAAGAIAGVWADIDVSHPVHTKAERLPGTREEAQEVMKQLPYEPTLIIDSGHGLQYWWVFNRPWVFQDEAEWGEARRTVQWWHQMTKELFDARGWTTDSVYDLSRILRIPGTYNNKVPEDRKEVTAIKTGGPRHDREDFLRLMPEEFVATAPAPEQRRGRKARSSYEASTTASGLILDPEAEPNPVRLAALLKADRKFQLSWDRNRPDLKDQSPSSYNMSLADIAVRAGWPDQEVVNLLICWRRMHGCDLKLRKRYHELTLARAKEAATELQGGFASGVDSNAEVDAVLDSEDEKHNSSSSSAAGESQPVGDAGGAPYTPLKERPTFRKDSHGLAGALAHLGLEVRYDDRLKIPEWRRIGEPDWQPFDDLWEAALREIIKDSCAFRGSDGKPSPAYFGEQAWKNALNPLLNRRRVDPFREWLQSRPAWDGKERLPVLFIDTLAAEDCPLVRQTAERWMIAIVARTLKPGLKHDWMPVLIGPQGGGKSAFAQHLLPENDYGWHSDSADLDLPKKELIEATYSAVIVEFGELAGAHRQDISKLKAFLSRYQDIIRLPWGYRREAIKRRWVPIATANNDGSGVLPEDLSGSRRWVAIEAPAEEGNYGRVVSYLAANRDQLWAEALNRFRAGEGWDFPGDLIQARNAANKSHTKNNDALRDNLAQITADFNGGTGYRLDELLERTKLPPGKRGQNVLMPHIHALGWTRHKGTDNVPRWYPPPKK